MNGPQTKKITRFLCAASLAGLFGSACGIRPETLKNGQPGTELPHCTNQKGEAVRYAAIPGAELQARHNAYIAAADRDRSGRPVIYYDRDIFPGLPRTFRKFVMKHECGHHKAGDVDAPTYEVMFTLMDRELAADCHAIQNLRDTEGFGLRETQEISEAAASIMRDRMIPESIVERRADNLFRCLRPAGPP